MTASTRASGWERKPHGVSPRVDQGLFGGGRVPRRRQPFWTEAAQPSAAAAATTDGEEAADVLVLEDSELARIKANSALPTAVARREQLEEERRQAAAESRKARIRALAEAGTRTTPRSEADLEQEAREEALRALAKERRFEELDTVKRLRALAALAEAFTLRDKQLQEQAARRAAERAYEARMDAAMGDALSAERGQHEAEEARRARQQQETRETLAAQIKARERQRLLAEEAREQEGLAMHALMERHREEERRERARKVAEARRLREEVLTAHQRALEARREAKEREREVSVGGRFWSRWGPARLSTVFTSLDSCP